MKTFSEFDPDQNAIELEEGAIRTTALSTYTAKSRAAGKKAETAFRQALSTLRARSPDDGVNQRLDRIEATLETMIEALRSQGVQINNGVAVDFVGHTLASKGSGRK